MKITTARGNLVRAPVQQRGGPHVFATIAVNTIGANGATATEHVDLIFPEPYAERILTHGKPGLTILVNGREHVKTYVKRDKSAGQTNEIFVTSLEL